MSMATDETPEARKARMRGWVRGKAARVAAMILFAVLLFPLVGVAVMWLWNALVPNIFGWSEISWLQALGLLVLARILFGGRGFSGAGGRRHRGDRWRRKWASMSPEERERWQVEMCGRAEPSPGSQPAG